MSTDERSQVLKEWGETAKYWTSYSNIIREMFMPLTRELIAEARIVAGHSVLDVAGGAGEPSLTIAETVGPTGSVTCTDGVKEMVDTAQAEGTKRGITNVKFQQCAAESLPFDDNSFDVVVCRLGAMLFADPLIALKEMLRVVKPGGRVAFVVWYKDELNPFTSIPTQVMSRHVPTEPSDPDAPGAFRFAELGKLASVLKEAGAVEIDERIFEFEMEAPISSSQFWSMRSQLSDKLRQQLEKLSESVQLQVAREVEREVADYFPDGHMRFPAQMLIVSGVK